MANNFLNNTSLIIYNKENYSCEPVTDIDQMGFINSPKAISWLNTYGTSYTKEFKSVVSQTHLDDFLLKLLSEERHPNKVIELDNVIFVAIKVLKTETQDFQTEQMFFYCNPSLFMEYSARVWRLF